jgi:glycosyltransferase involved in cell wall biosynthesis
MGEKNNLSVSVVIPTLGGEELKKTIAHLNSGSVKPKEILICIPVEYSSKVDDLKHENVKVIATKSKGQVVQRAIGFQHALCDYVLQIDDDITLAFECIEKLLGALVLDEKSVVAPVMINISTGCSAYSINGNAIVRKIYYFLMNGFDGYQPGKIDKAGTAVGVNVDDFPVGVLETEWLPGGCVMHHRKNLILEDFYPFIGKAFNEDVIHSVLLRKGGRKLFIVAKATCYFEVQSIIFEGNIKNIWKDYVSRRYAMKLENKHCFFRVYVYYFISLMSLMLKKWFH